MRRGPGTQYAVIMRLARNYPLRVLDRWASADSIWLKVMDVDGDRGWITAKLVKLTPFVITKLGESNVRTGNSTDDPIVFTAEKGVLLRVQQEKNGWLRVKHSDGDEGWISAKIVFGWQDVDDSKG